MADILKWVEREFQKRYRDMLDGSHAEVVAIGSGDVDATLQVGGADISNCRKAHLRTEEKPADAPELFVVCRTTEGMKGLNA